LRDGFVGFEGGDFVEDLEDVGFAVVEEFAEVG